MKRPLIIALLALTSLLFVVPASASGLVKAGNNLGLKAYYSFEDGAGLKATDFSGSGNIGTLTNGPAWVGGKHGKALSFDGNDDSVGLAQTNGLPIYSKTNPYSIAFWVKATGSQGACIFCESTGGSSAAIVRIMVPASGNTVQVVIRDDGSATSQNQAGNLIAFDGTWHHVVWTDSAGTAKIYVDGVLDSANFNYSPSGTFTLDTDKLGALFFNGNAGTQFLNGFLDDFRIYNRALSATEVAALYNQSGIARSNISQNTIASDNLTLWQTFDNNKIVGTTARDSSAQSNNGTISGSPAPAIGKVGQALNFNGTNYVTLGSSLNQGSGSYSVSAWLKPSSFSGCDGSGDGCIFINQMSNNQGDFYFGFNSSGVLSAVFIESGPTAVTRRVDSGGANPTIAVPGEWYHVLITRNSSGPTYTIYINGVSQPLTTFATGSGSGGTRIGTELAGNPIYSFRGIIDDVRIYNKALSASEALQLYNQGAGTKTNQSQSAISNGLVLWHTFDGNKLNTTTSTDSSGQSNNGTLSGGPRVAIGKIGQALSFDGSNDYTSISDNATLKFGTSSMSVSAWIKPPNSNQNGYVVTKFQAVAFTGYTLSITGADSFGSSGKKIGFLLYNGNTGDYRGAYTNNDVVDGNWHHIVGVNTGAALAIYVDGVSVAITNDRTNGSWPNTDNNVGVGIGATNSGGGLVPYAGLIDDVRIYNRALSASEVLQLYNAGK